MISSTPRAAGNHAYGVGRGHRRHRGEQFAERPPVLSSPVPRWARWAFSNRAKVSHASKMWWATSPGWGGTSKGKGRSLVGTEAPRPACAPSLREPPLGGQAPRPRPPGPRSRSPRQDVAGRHRRRGSGGRCRRCPSRRRLRAGRRRARPAGRPGRRTARPGSRRRRSDRAGRRCAEPPVSSSASRATSSHMSSGSGAPSGPHVVGVPGAAADSDQAGVAAGPGPRARARPVRTGGPDRAA